MEQTLDATTMAWLATKPVVEVALHRDLDISSPCAGWTAKEVLTHLYEVVRDARTSDDASASSNDEPITADSFEDAFNGMMQALQSARAKRKKVVIASRELPPASAAAAALVEIAIHGWDLATAIGEEYPLDSLTAWVLASLIEAYPADLRDELGFATAHDPGEAATDLERAIALSGRQI